MGATEQQAGSLGDGLLSADEIRALEGLRYKTDHLALVLSRRDKHRESPFWHHLLRIARPAALAYDGIMTAHAGNPAGAEYRHEERQAWAVVHEDAANGGKWRVTEFEACGFTGHDCFPTLEAAVCGMVRDGYRVLDGGVLDALSKTPAWEEGTRIAALMSRKASRAVEAANGDFGRERQ